MVRNLVLSIWNKPKLQQFLKLHNTNQCPSGYQRTTNNNTCQQCPRNYISPNTHSQCTQCTNPTITNGTGQTQCFSPDPCTPNYCNGHGHCLVSKQSKPICQCQYGYLPSDNCKFPRPPYRSSICYPCHDTGLPCSHCSLQVGLPQDTRETQGTTTTGQTQRAQSQTEEA